MAQPTLELDKMLQARGLPTGAVFGEPCEPVLPAPLLSWGGGHTERVGGRVPACRLVQVEVLVGVVPVAKTLVEVRA